MKRISFAAALLTVAAPGLVVASAAATQADQATPGSSVVSTVRSHMHIEASCKQTVAKGRAACFAMKLVPNGQVTPAASQPTGGLTPSGLQSAYKLAGLKSGGRTVAIVDAYGYPNLERDLTTYRNQYGLPSCTTANGCLKIESQTGSSSLPAQDTGWDQEQALDVDAVSAACPDCKILMVQVKSPSFANLGAGVNTAAKGSGVVAISNSYGGDDAADSANGSYYNHPGIAVTASTGDDGYQGASYPASSAYATAVGGTSLDSASNSRGWTETVWSGAGSGCSTMNKAIAAASSFDTGCSGRAMADVSAAADPSNGGLSVYYPTSATASTWGQIGGTSESSPIIASVYALSGNTSGTANAIPYGHSSSFFDVTSGSNGSCPTTQWCNARTGWDGPTGLGTPNGVGGF